MSRRGCKKWEELKLRIKKHHQEQIKASQHPSQRVFFPLKVPGQPIYTGIKDLEVEASQQIRKLTYDYYRSGANAQISLADAEEGYKHIKLKKSCFGSIGLQPCLKTSILGHQIASPICIASTAMQRMAHPEGEIAMANAARLSNNTPILLSSWCTTRPEEVAMASPDSFKIFQLYLSRLEDIDLDIWKRVKQAGFKALALTCDTQVLGKRENDVRNAFELPEGMNMAVYERYFPMLGQLMGGSTVQSSGKDSGLSEFVNLYKNNDVSWQNIKQIKQISGLPVIAKGILCKEDALLAVKYGADGVFVSNHGSRQLDTTPAPIDVLEEIVQALKGTNVEVYFDGGVRRGTDVIKALALGAQCVFLGRPILWGLGADGEQGVVKALDLLNEELKEAMVQTGCANVAAIKKEKILYKKDELLVHH